VVSESGIHTSEDINFVRNAGINAVLIGESLIKKPNPGKALLQLFTEKES
jgi:indole-3-glycerol phosphate synthase